MRHVACRFPLPDPPLSSPAVMHAQQETLAADPTFIASNFLNFLKGIQVEIIMMV
jgi:hypothetical protein